VVYNGVIFYTIFYENLSEVSNVEWEEAKTERDTYNADFISLNIPKERKVG
jgi:hypothetical protein